MAKLRYFNSFKDDYGFIHSIDKCSITFILKEQKVDAFDGIICEFCSLCDKYSIVPDIKKDLPPRSSLSWCKHLFKFRYGFVAFIGYYQMKDKNKKDWSTVYTVRLEFNPNKQLIDYDYNKDSDFSVSFICGAAIVLDVCKYLNNISSSCQIKRVDYAIDLPLNLYDVIVPCSQKSHSFFKNTNYYGVSGSHGRLKIYDKQKESNLDNILTRVEYTFKYHQAIKFEDVYLLNYMEGEKVEEKKITSNTRVLCRLCMTLKSNGIPYFDLIKDLNSRKRKEVIESVESSGFRLNVDSKNIDYLVDDLSNFLGLNLDENDILLLDKDGFVIISDDEEIPFL